MTSSDQLAVFLRREFTGARKYRRLIWIAPKYSVAQIIGHMEGKSSIWIAQNVERKMRNFLGHKFWARGYFVTTVGRDEEVIRAYIRNQELADRQLEHFELISAAQNPNNRPTISKNRLWRFPIKPPALLEVIGCDSVRILTTC
jgi:hypothetical protein